MKTFAESFWQDVRFAARSLVRVPGFLTVVVLSLALGIGANTTIFSVINAVMYRPLPFYEAGRLMMIWQKQQSDPSQHISPPIAETVDWRKQNHVFEDIALTSWTEEGTLSGAGEPHAIQLQDVTPNFFDLLGVKPVLGRIFTSDEAQDKTQTVVISSEFWKSQFDRDPNVLGKTFTLGGVVSTVVGVMPLGFAPFFNQRVDLWQPINPESARYSERTDHWLEPIGRLKPGTTLKQAQVEMDLVAQRLEQAYPTTNTGIGITIIPLHEELFGWTGKVLYPLLGAVGFVLLIACANVANLFQSRTEGRRKEYALRLSLGASRRRLMQQLFAESGLLALIGGTLGVLLSFGGIQLFLLFAVEFPNSSSIRVDGQVLLFTVAVTLLTALLFGIAPALQAASPDTNALLKEGGRTTGGSSRGIMRHLLAVSEVALATVLLVGAGLMINTMLRLQRVDPGFDPTNVATTRLELPEGGRYVERIPGGDMEKATPRVTAFYQQLLDKAGTMPGVESAGIISSVYGSLSCSFSIVAHPAPPKDRRPGTGYNAVSTGLFRTLKIPLKQGRYLDDGDTATSPWVVVINQAFADRYFPHENPLGQQLLLRYESYGVDELHPRQIVGIVGDVKHAGLNEAAPPFVYTSYLQQPEIYPGGWITSHIFKTLVVRTSSTLQGHEGELGAAIKRAVAELDPDQPIASFRTMDDLLTSSVGDFRFYMRLLGLFAAMAVLMAIMGVYGVMSYFVTRRTHEIGIRVALGARHADVLTLFGRLGLKLALIGVVIGVGLSLALTHLIAGFLFGVKPTDPLTYAAVAAAIMAVAVAASLIPARRATKIDPMIALRYE